MFLYKQGQTVDRFAHVRHPERHIDLDLWSCGQHHNSSRLKINFFKLDGEKSSLISMANLFSCNVSCSDAWLGVTTEFDKTSGKKFSCLFDDLLFLLFQ